MLEFKKDAIWAPCRYIHQSMKASRMTVQPQSILATEALLQLSAQKSEAVGMSRFLVRDDTLQLHISEREISP